MRGYLNTFIYTTVGTSINLLLTTMVHTLYHEKTCMVAMHYSHPTMYFFTMFFSGGMIPTYLVVKSLHMLNTIWAMVIPGDFCL